MHKKGTIQPKIIFSCQISWALKYQGEPLDPQTYKRLKILIKCFTRKIMMKHFQIRLGRSKTIHNPWLEKLLWYANFKFLRFQQILTSQFKLPSNQVCCDYYQYIYIYIEGKKKKKKTGNRTDLKLCQQ